MEKPAGLNSVETYELIKIARENKTFCMVGYNRRFYSVVGNGLSALSEFGPIRGGVLEVPEAISEVIKRKKYSDEILSKWIYTQSSHAIDLFRHILGEILDTKFSQIFV